MQTILILLRIPCHPERPLSPMDRDHGETIVRALEDKGYRVAVVPLDTEPP